MSRFTDTYVKSRKPTAKRYEEYEGGGFGLRVSPAGLKTWIYRYKIDGKTEKLTLGHYPTMGVANAKKHFMELSGLRKDGCNPKDHIQQQEQQETNTVSKLVLEWFKGYAEKARKKPQQIKQQIDADIIPLLGDRILDTVQTRDITKALDVIVARGAPIHANRVLSTLKQAFNYGVSRGTIQHNPANNIRSRDIGGIEKPRERFLSMCEIKQLWHFLDSDKHQMAIHTRNAIKILLLTGVRTSELRLAKWDDFNFEDSLWIIPAENSKVDTVTKIHLSPQVKQLLLELKVSNCSIYVLPSVTGDSPMSDNALPRAISRIQSRVGLPQWRAHDLRRTFATQLGETLHIDPVVIEKCLGHKMPRIMATYNKNQMLPERAAALDKWGQYIEGLTSNKNVIPFDKAI